MSKSPPAKASYTGRARRKTNRWSVKFADVTARVLITVGGIGTIVAVCLVFVFLGLVVVPLFNSATVETADRYEADWVDKNSVKMAIDEYQSMGWALYDDGELQVFRIDTGETIDRRKLFSDIKLTAASTTVGQDDIALGFEDGTVRFGKIGFDVVFRERKEVPEAYHDLAAGESMVMEDGVVQRTPQGQLRLQKVVFELGPPVKIAESPITQLGHIAPDDSDGLIGGKQFTAAVYSQDDRFRFCKISETENAFTGAVSLESKAFDLPFSPVAQAAPKKVLITGRGDNVFLVWDNGRLDRFDTRSADAMALVERVDLLPNTSAKVTVCDFILGRETVVVGDQDGGLRAWFRVRRGEQDAGGLDSFRMAMVHELQKASAAPTSVGASQRSRMLAAGYDDGRVRVFHVTTEQMVMEQQAADNVAVRRVAIAPKDDGLFATTSTGVWRCQFDPAYPEATFASLFTPVWYEGYNEPLSIWQSSFAGVGPEMKLGLMPLIFGTLKATFYSMLFGAPLALLAAIYTSEFLGSRGRGRIKPVIEMMASLPSVVLGFLAALVFAPVVEGYVPETLACFVTVPLTFLLMSQLWHLLPYRTATILQRHRFLFMFLVMPVGFFAGILLGPVAETWLFADDIKRWLNEHGEAGENFGSGVGAWLFILLPLSALVIVGLLTSYGNTWLRSNAHRWSRQQFAVLNLGKFLLGVAATFGLAYGLACLFDLGGFDPRGTYVDTYEQRNALVVGFVMGFAIIPIIYTIADDALSTVPNHLRSGSLGCGATPWQTTWRVVIPTAMSGLFSALMIGLGRAVGETMIVLMAGGNTPVTDWNIFNGFRTLAANIAVELPEAVRNSTHFRTLFLAALTLFILTFVINTAAEIVRLRFRKRAYQL